MLDLFSGSNSVGQYFTSLGYDVVSVDILPQGEPTFCEDILAWDYRLHFPKGYFQVIAAGVPCEEYSRAMTKRPRELDRADKLVLKTLEIIDYFNPPIWWIENPATGLLKSRSVIQGLPYVDLDYCQFSDWGFQKPTRIWCCSRVAKLPNRKCDPMTCPNMVAQLHGRKRHRERLGG